LLEVAELPGDLIRPRGTWVELVSGRPRPELANVLQIIQQRL